METTCLFGEPEVERKLEDKKRVEKYASPFDYLKALFSGADLTDDQLKNYSSWMMTRILSCDIRLSPIVKQVNRFDLQGPKHYRVLLGFFAGKNRYIKYQRKEKLELSDEFMKFRGKVCQLFGWSVREFNTVFQWFDESFCKTEDFAELIRMTATDWPEEELVREYFKTSEDGI